MPLSTKPDETAAIPTSPKEAIDMNTETEIKPVARKVGKTALLASTSQKRVALIASEKGGVGKSVFMQVLVATLRADNHRVAAFDADGSVGSTLGVLGERDENGSLIVDQNPVVGSGYYDGRADGDRNVLLDCTTSGEALYVHDLAGGTRRDLSKILDSEEGLDALANAFAIDGYRLTIFHLIAPSKGSTISVGKWLDMTGDKMDHVAVLNSKLGKPPSEFPFWYGHTDSRGVAKGGKARAKLLDLGGKEIVFPALSTSAFAKLEAEDVPIVGAETSPLLTKTEQHQVYKFVADFRAAIAPIMPWLVG
jgi:hypothetical protein